MKLTIELSDEAVDALGVALAKAIQAKPPKAKKEKPAKAEAPAEAEVEDVENDETETETEATDETPDAAEDFGEDTGTTSKVAREDVLAALKDVTAKVNQDAAMAVLKKTGGVSKLSSLPEGKFEAVIKACKDAVAKAKK